MKRIVFLILFVSLAIVEALPQSASYSNASTSEIALNLDFEKKTYQLIRDDSNPQVPDVFMTTNLSDGKITRYKDYIVCTSYQGVKYELKYIDEYKLLNLGFRELGYVIYKVGQYQKGKSYRIFHGYWKNGKKNGYWLYFTKPGTYYTKQYKDDILVECTTDKIRREK